MKTPRTKYQKVCAIAKIIFDKELNDTQAFRIFQYFDDRYVFFRMDELYRLNQNNYTAFCKSLNSMVKWSTIDKDIVDNFYENALYTLERN